MVSISKVCLLIIFPALFLQCVFKPPASQDTQLQKKTHTQILSAVRVTSQATMKAYNVGDFETARDELELVLQLLDLLNKKSYLEKIQFLDKKFSYIDKKHTFMEIADKVLFSVPGHEIKGAKPTASQKGVKATSKDSVFFWVNPKKLDDPMFEEEFSFEEELSEFIQQEIRKVAIQMGENENFNLPKDFIREIEFYIYRFQTQPYYNRFFKRALRRSRKYIPLLRKYFLERGFPEEIMYIAFIESGFNPVAHSRSNAVGIFQFLKSTGEHYGLKIDNSVDERLSPFKSAVACREFLHDLLLELGSFPLALGSYNAGSGKTRWALRQLKDFKNRNFWSLRNQTKSLHKETLEYVPQIFAAIVMAKPGHPQKFGFKDVPFPDSTKYHLISLSKQVSLTYLAEAAKLNVSDILKLNPDLEEGATETPARVVDYPLFVPRKKGKRIEKIVSKMMKSNKKMLVQASKQRIGVEKVVNRPNKNKNDNRHFVKYHVKRGNTLFNIALWFGKSIDELKKWNPFLKKRSIRSGDTVYIRELRDDWKQESHVVKSGETLRSIARKYRIKSDDIAQWNGLKNINLKIGQNLVLYLRKQKSISAATMMAGSTAPAVLPQKKNATVGVTEVQTISVGETFRYVVTLGNTPEKVAALFGVSTQQLKEWNNLASMTLRVGQRLRVVSGKNMKFYRYQVQYGDTLDKIARRFSTNSDTIQFINGKSSSILRLREILNIYSISF